MIHPEVRTRNKIENCLDHTIIDMVEMAKRKALAM